MEARKLLIYFYIKYKTDWEKIYNAIRDKEEVDMEKAEKAVNKFCAEHNVLTLLDTHPLMERFKKAMKPPFVVVWDGDKELLSRLGGYTIGCEEIDMWDCVVASEHHFIAGYVPSPEASYSTISFRQIDPKSHMEATVTLKVEDEPIWARRRLGQISSSLLVSKAEDEPSRALISEAITSGATLYAVPGAAGSATNKLIKEGANLCDTPDDLVPKEE